jgi:hypothetical protein
MINPEFLRKVRVERERVARTPFFILLWGPAPSARLGEKRLVIREHLSHQFGAENVIFSEDEDLDLQNMREEYGDRAAEFYQASAADVVFVLAESIGSITEVALYDRVLAGKSIIFVEKRPPERLGFASQAYALLTIEAVEPEEWQSCERLRRRCSQFAETMRVEKYKLEKYRMESS